jgi:signal transduction histidine kinase
MKLVHIFKSGLIFLVFLIFITNLVSAEENLYEERGTEIADTFVELLDSAVEDTLIVANFDFSNVDSAKLSIKLFYNQKFGEIWFNLGSDEFPSEKADSIPIYSEISFINSGGMEIIKYSNGNYTLNLKDVSKVENTEFLSETYFEDTKNLLDGEVFIGNVMAQYVSKEQVFVDLSEEFYNKYEYVVGRDIMKNGIIRFSSPVYKEGEFIGIVVLSLDYRHLQELTKHIDPILNSNVVSTSYANNYILVFDNEGNTIIHPKPDNIRGYLLDGQLAGFNELNSTRTGSIFNLFKYEKSPVYKEIASSIIYEGKIHTSSVTDVSGRTKLTVAIPILYSRENTNYANLGVYGGLMMSINLQNGEQQSFVDFILNNLFYFILLLFIILITMAFIYFKNLRNRLSSGIGKKLLISLLIISLGPLLIISYITIDSQLDLFTKDAFEDMGKDVNNKENIISEILGNFREDLLFLSHETELIRYMDSDDVEFKNMQKEFLAKELLEFSKQKKDYYQLRYIDETGQEIIRIDYDGINSKIVSEELLQNKANRYYFQNTMNLNKNEVFVSPLDLNIEKGILENRGTSSKPSYVPVIRYGTPVFDSQNNPRGILITNIYANYVLNPINEENIGGVDVFLINKDGYYLHNPEINKEFGFMHGNDITLKTEFQGINLDIFRLDEGLIFDENTDSYFVFKRIQVSDEKYWVLINSISNKYIFSSINSLRDKIIGVGLLILSLIILFSYFISKKFSKPIEQLIHGSEELQRKNFKFRVDVKSKDEMGYLGEVFNQTASVLQKMDENYKQLEKAKTEFISITSHELRSPMTPMRAQLQMLMKEYFGKLNPKQKDAVDIVLRNTTRLDGIIVDFLEVSRIEAARLKFNFIKTNLGPHVKRLVDEMNVFMPEKKIKILLKLEKLPTFSIDPDRTMQVLRNLINNAIKFSPENSNIIITVKNKKDNIYFSVKDNGAGIPKKSQSRIFEPFFQAEQTIYWGHSGTGLGLAICKGIIESQKGKIGFKSIPKKGTIFYFTVPKKPVKSIKPIKLLFSS